MKEVFHDFLNDLARPDHTLINFCCIQPHARITPHSIIFVCGSVFMDIAIAPLTDGQLKPLFTDVQNLGFGRGGADRACSC